MENSEHLIYLSNKTKAELNELWQNCFEGNNNLIHMNAYVPYPVHEQEQLNSFLIAERNYKTWLVKRKLEKDIIGFAIHGDFFPGLPNNIGFNVGLNYIRQGHATEILRALINYLKNINLKETYGHCLSSNQAAIRTMGKCGFINMGQSGNEYIGMKELKFKIDL